MPGSDVDALRNDPRRSVLRLESDLNPFAVAGLTVAGKAVSTVYCDFGGLSVRYRVPFEGTSREWADLSHELSGNAAFLLHASRLARDLAARLAPATTKPSVSKEVEDYSVFHVEVPAGTGVDRLIAYEGDNIARMVNAEVRPLHPDVVAAVLGRRISWYTDYAAFVDWPAAVLFSDGSPEAAEHVRITTDALEFVNMQLLQFEILGNRLDHTILRAYQMPSSTQVSPAEQAELDELTMDCVDLFGRVGSGLKIFSSVHLAHLLKAVSRRFEFQDRANEIRMKLVDLRNVRHGMAEQSRHRQSHSVEILIAGLIVVELLPLLFGIVKSLW